MRDEIMRLAERAADMLDGFEQALRRYAPIEDIEEWPYHPEITDTAAELRDLARTDHVEDKLGMVPAPYAMARNDAGVYVDRLGWKHGDQFAEGWNACREAMIAANPAPDHSAGVLRIPRAASLDPIIVYFEDSAPGKGRITIACYGDAWTGAWGAMGNRTVRQFVAGCDPGYLSGSLLELRKASEHFRKYTERVSAAVIDALAQQAKDQDAAT